MLEKNKGYELNPSDNSYALGFAFYLSDPIDRQKPSFLHLDPNQFLLGFAHAVADYDLPPTHKTIWRYLTPFFTRSEIKIFKRSHDDFLKSNPNIWYRWPVGVHL
jgi:hypothetical protein